GRGLDATIGQTLVDACRDRVQADCMALKRSGEPLQATLVPSKACGVACVLTLAGVRTGDMGDTCSETSKTLVRSDSVGQEKSVTDQREDFVRLALASGANVAELCRRFGISRANAYKWIMRYQAEGSGGLRDRSRRPHHSPRRSVQRTEAEVLRIRDGSNN